MDGPEEDCAGGHKGSWTVKLQHWHTLHVILTGLTQADVVVEGEDMLWRDERQQRAVQVQLLLELLSGVEAAWGATRQQGWESNVEDTRVHVRVILYIEDEHAITAGGQHSSYALCE